MSIKENIDLDINLNIDKHKLKDLSKQVTDSISAPREITVRISNADIDNNTILNQLDDVYSELENKAKNKKPINFNSPIFSVDKEQIKLTFNELDRSVHAFTNKLTQSRIKTEKEIDKIKKEFLSIKLTEANYDNIDFSLIPKKLVEKFQKNTLHSWDKDKLLRQEKIFDKIEEGRETQDSVLNILDKQIEKKGLSAINKEKFDTISRLRAIYDLKDQKNKSVDVSKLEQEKRDKLDDKYLKHLDTLAKYEEDFDNNKITKDIYHEITKAEEDRWRKEEGRITADYNRKKEELKKETFKNYKPSKEEVDDYIKQHQIDRKELENKIKKEYDTDLETYAKIKHDPKHYEKSLFEQGKFLSTFLDNGSVFSEDFLKVHNGNELYKTIENNPRFSWFEKASLQDKTRFSYSRVNKQGDDLNDILGTNRATGMPFDYDIYNNEHQGIIPIEQFSKKSVDTIQKKIQEYNKLIEKNVKIDHFLENFLENYHIYSYNVKDKLREHTKQTINSLVNSSVVEDTKNKLNTLMNKFKSLKDTVLDTSRVKDTFKSALKEQLAPREIKNITSALKELTLKGDKLRETFTGDPNPNTVFDRLEVSTKKAKYSIKDLYETFKRDPKATGLIKEIEKIKEIGDEAKKQSQAFRQFQSKITEFNPKLKNTLDNYKHFTNRLDFQQEYKKFYDEQLVHMTDSDLINDETLRFIHRYRNELERLERQERRTQRATNNLTRAERRSTANRWEGMTLFHRHNYFFSEFGQIIQGYRDAIETLRLPYDMWYEKGIRLNKMLEDQRNNIASIISGNIDIMPTVTETVVIKEIKKPDFDTTNIGYSSDTSKIIDISEDSYKDETKKLTSYEKFLLSTEKSQKILKQLKEESIKTVATFPELVEIFNNALTPALTNSTQAMGKTLEETIQNTIKLSKRFANIGGAMGMSMDMINEEIRSTLEANITKDTRIAKMLGITNADIKAAKQQVNGLVDFLNEKLGYYDVLEEETTYSKTLNTLKDSIDELMIETSKPLFDDLYVQLATLSDYLRDNAGDIVDSFNEIYESVTKTISVASDWLSIPQTVLGGIYSAVTYEDKGTGLTTYRVKDLQEALTTNYNQDTHVAINEIMDIRHQDINSTKAYEEAIQTLHKYDKLIEELNVTNPKTNFQEDKQYLFKELEKAKKLATEYLDKKKQLLEIKGKMDKEEYRTYLKHDKASLNKGAVGQAIGYFKALGYIDNAWDLQKKLITQRFEELMQQLTPDQAKGLDLDKILSIEKDKFYKYSNNKSKKLTNLLYQYQKELNPLSDKIFNEDMEKLKKKYEYLIKLSEYLKEGSKATKEQKEKAKNVLGDYKFDINDLITKKRLDLDIKITDKSIRETKEELKLFKKAGIDNDKTKELTDRLHKLQSLKELTSHSDFYGNYIANKIGMSDKQTKAFINTIKTYKSIREVLVGLKSINDLSDNERKILESSHSLFTSIKQITKAKKELHKVLIKEKDTTKLIVSYYKELGQLNNADFKESYKEAYKNEVNKKYAGLEELKTDKLTEKFNNDLEIKALEQKLNYYQAIGNKQSSIVELQKELINLKEKTKMMTVPQIFIDDELIGGYTELTFLISTNEFQEKMK